MLSAIKEESAMFQGKLKAITFSYDDGVTQDQRLIAMLNHYGMKATFNLNSGLLGKPGSLVREDVTVAHAKPRPCEVSSIYRGHEVAAHTLTHPMLPDLPDEEVIRQVEEDRLKLSDLAGYEVVGMAYPCGGVNNDDRVAKIIREHTGVRYSRTISSTHSFELQENLYRFNPSVYHLEWEKMMEMAEQFVVMKPETPQIFYIWGHSFEMDYNNTYWDRLEALCKLISGREDTFYGTNREVLL